jgi:hypothetical protein
MRGGIPLGLAGLLFLAGCNINEVDMPDSPCRKVLKGASAPQGVDFVRSAPGQISVFRKFRIEGDSLRYTRDTLVAQVGAQYPDAFELIEHECPENYLSPYLPGPSSHILQRLGGNLRPSGFTRLLPYDGYVGFELHPQGPLLDFPGLRPPDGLTPPLYGRIAGFALAGRTHDTVAVRVERLERLKYWIYSAEAGPLVAASEVWDGSIEGWARVE